MGSSSSRSLSPTARRPPAGPLLDQLEDPEPSPLPEMTQVEETMADYGGVQLTLGPHPMAYLRTQAARRERVVTAAGLEKIDSGRRVAPRHRQRPPLPHPGR
jgi:hypothetical protein